MAQHAAQQLSVPMSTDAQYRSQSFSLPQSSLSPLPEPFQSLHGRRLDNVDPENMSRRPSQQFLSGFQPGGDQAMMNGYMLDGGNQAGYGSTASYNGLVPTGPTVNQLLNRGGGQTSNTYSRPRIPQNATITTVYPESTGLKSNPNSANIVSPIGMSQHMSLPNAPDVMMLRTAQKDAQQGRAQAFRGILSPQARAFEGPNNIPVGLMQPQMPQQQQQQKPQLSLPQLQQQQMQMQLQQQQQQQQQQRQLQLPPQQSQPQQQPQLPYSINGMNSGYNTLNAGQSLSPNGIDNVGLGMLKPVSQSLGGQTYLGQQQQQQQSQRSQHQQQVQAQAQAQAHQLQGSANSQLAGGGVSMPASSTAQFVNQLNQPPPNLAAATAAAMQLPNSYGQAALSSNAGGGIQSAGGAGGQVNAATGAGVAGGLAGPTLAQEEICTIFVVGFPDDMQEREFQNMFTFSPGFEAATLKIPNKDLTSYGPGALAPGSTAAAAVSALRQAGYASNYAGAGASQSNPSDPYSLVTLNAQGGLIDSREISSGLAAAAASGWPMPDDPFGRNSASGMVGMGGNPTDLTSHLSLPMPRKQIIGFAKFRTRDQALEARDVLQGRRIDVEKGAVLKAEMAKKNLHTKRGVGPLGLQAGSSGGGLPLGADAIAVLAAQGGLGTGTLQSGALGNLALGGGYNGVNAANLGNFANINLGGNQILQQQLFSPQSEPLQMPSLQRDQMVGAMGLGNGMGATQRSLDRERERDRQQRERNDMEVVAYQQAQQVDQQARQVRVEQAQQAQAQVQMQARLRMNNGPAFDAFHSMPEQGQLQDPQSSQLLLPGGLSAINSRNGSFSNASAGISGMMLSPTSDDMSPNSGSGYGSFELINGPGLTKYGDSGFGVNATSQTSTALSGAHLPASLGARRQSQTQQQQQTSSQQEPFQSSAQGLWTSLPNTNDAHSNALLQPLPQSASSIGRAQPYAASNVNDTSPSSSHSQLSQGAEGNESHPFPSSSRGTSSGIPSLNDEESESTARMHPEFYQQPLPLHPTASSSSASSSESPIKDESYMTQYASSNQMEFVGSPDSDMMARSMGGMSLHTHAGITSPQLSSPTSGSSGFTRTNSADQNPPINTLYVGNLPTSPPTSHPPNYLEENLRSLFSGCAGYRKLCFRQKNNGPMCFVEFEDVVHASKALADLYGHNLNGLVKGGIRLSYSKNPLGVRTGSVSSGTSHAAGTNHGPSGHQEGGRYARHPVGFPDSHRAPSRQSSTDMLSPTASSFDFNASPPSRFFSPPPALSPGPSSFSPVLAPGRTLPSPYARGGNQAFPDSAFSPFAVPDERPAEPTNAPREEDFECRAHSFTASPGLEARR